jgi:hypothetical protein
MLLRSNKTLLNQACIVAIKAQTFTSQVQLPSPDSKALLIAIKEGSHSSLGELTVALAKVVSPWTCHLLP